MQAPTPHLTGGARRSKIGGLFDSLSHPDLVKIFGARVMSFDYAAVADAIAESGIAVEVSTAGLRKPVRELYYAAEKGFRSMETRPQAVENYKTLKADYAATSLVKAYAERISRLLAVQLAVGGDDQQQEVLPRLDDERLGPAGERHAPDGGGLLAGEDRRVVRDRAGHARGGQFFVQTIEDQSCHRTNLPDEEHGLSRGHKDQIPFHAARTSLQAPRSRAAPAR